MKRIREILGTCIALALSICCLGTPITTEARTMDFNAMSEEYKQQYITGNRYGYLTEQEAELAWYEEAYKAWSSVTSTPSETLEVLKTEKTSAIAVYNQGSLGFFTDLANKGNADAAKAVSVLTDNTLADATTMGGDKDATNLLCMYQALKVLRYGITVSKEDLGFEYKISSELMAIAQERANEDAIEEDHCEGYGGFYENLAFGLSNPYSGWYWEERYQYENVTTDWATCGHYMALTGKLSSGCFYTGIGLTINSKWNEVYTNLYGYKVETGVMTYDTYLSTFDKYFRDIVYNMELAKAQYAKKEGTYTSDFSKVKTDYNNAVSRYNRLKSLYEEASDQLTYLLEGKVQPKTATLAASSATYTKTLQIRLKTTDYSTSLAVKGMKFKVEYYDDSCWKKAGTYTTNSSGIISKNYKMTGTVKTGTYKYLTNYSSLHGEAKKEADKMIAEGTLYKTKALAESKRSKDLANLKKKKETSNTSVRYTCTSAKSGFYKPSQTKQTIKVNTAAYKTISCKRTGYFKGKFIKSTSKYIVNTRTKKIHKKNCKYTKNKTLYKNAKEYNMSISTLKRKYGYKCCQTCLKGK